MGQGVSAQEGPTGLGLKPKEAQQGDGKNRRAEDEAGQAQIGVSKPVDNQEQDKLGNAEGAGGAKPQTPGAQSADGPALPFDIHLRATPDPVKETGANAPGAFQALAVGVAVKLSVRRQEAAGTEGQEQHCQ